MRPDDYDFVRLSRAQYLDFEIDAGGPIDVVFLALHCEASVRQLRFEVINGLSQLAWTSAHVSFANFFGQMRDMTAEFSSEFQQSVIGRRQCASVTAARHQEHIPTCRETIAE
jgi:hypothetical protein